MNIEIATNICKKFYQCDPIPIDDLVKALKEKGVECNFHTADTPEIKASARAVGEIEAYEKATGLASGGKLYYATLIDRQAPLTVRSRLTVAGTHGLGEALTIAAANWALKETYGEEFKCFNLSDFNHDRTLYNDAVFNQEITLTRRYIGHSFEDK